MKRDDTPGVDPVSNGSRRLTARPRRLRVSEPIREMVREHDLRTSDLISPIFVTVGRDVVHPIESMPGVSRLSVDRLAPELDLVADLGIRAVLLFGIPAAKDATGSGSFAEDGIVQQAVSQIKRLHPEIAVITDTCLCEYTDHGHCGILGSARPGSGEPGVGGAGSAYLLNDETLEVLRRVAISQARAGADIVAPSGMVDGMVAAIREALDREGFETVGIMSYAVKYASSFYGPFRDAADGAPTFGDRRTHQMDPANRREAIREARLDAEEGADFLIVKPALSYLDIVRGVRECDTGLPVVAYNVSGEFAMVKAAAERGWIDEKRIVLETLTGMRRAGADLIVTYHAKDAAKWLEERR